VKWLKRYTVVAASMLLMSLIGLSVYHVYQTQQNERDAVSDQLETYRSYWLDSDGTLGFSLKAGKNNLRLLTNAAVANELETSAGITSAEEQFYSLRYRILANDNAILADKIYYLPLRISVVNGKVRRRLIDHSGTPSDTNEVHLDTSDFPDAARLELKQGRSSQVLVGMNVRAYFQERRADDKLDRYWQRLHGEKKQRAARTNAYEVEFLTPFEKRNLMRWRWRPLVATGIENEDYNISLIADEPVEEIEAAAMHIDQRLFLPAGRASTIGLQENTQLLINVLSGESAGLDVNDVTVTWSGRFAHERMQIPLSPTDGGLQSKVTVDRGILMFEASQDVWLEVADVQRNQLIEPQVNVVRVYPTSLQPVNIPIRHGRGAPTPVRLDVRMPFGVESTDLQVSLLAQGRVVDTQKINLDGDPSKLDWLVFNGDQQPISDAARVYLDVPIGVDQLSVSTNAEAWVVAYNRPAKLSRQTLIPESLFGGTEAAARFPAWFILLPGNADQLLNTGTSALVHSQLSAPSESEGEDRVSKRMLPLEPGYGTTLLTLNDVQQVIPPTALAAHFTELLPGGQELTFTGTSSSAEITPTLLIQRSGARSGTLEISDGDRTLLELALDANSSGRVRLPSIAPGQRRWLVAVPDDTRIWVNYVESTQSYREQSVQALPVDTYTYSLNRLVQERESLAVRIFSSSPGRVSVGLRLLPWRRSEVFQQDRTMSDVVFDLALEPQTSVLSPFEAGAPLTYMATAFYPIGADVPAGDMQLQVYISKLEVAGSDDAKLYLGMTRSSSMLSDKAPLRIRNFEVSQR
jgi:type II secretory pathway component PulJ